jgi:ABC-2 type transport system permease protein
MRRIRFLIVKEFKQIFRSRAMLPIIFVMPILQLLILANAATFEIKNLNLIIVDKDHSQFSRDISSKFRGSPYFKISDKTFTTSEAEDQIKLRNADIYLEIPVNFEKQLVRESSVKMQIVVNAIDGSKGSLAGFYASNIIQDYSKDLSLKYGIRANLISPTTDFKQIEITYSNWFNPNLDYKTFMVPGLLVLLVSLISVFLSSMNIVREKEIGTIESINVTPIRKYQFILGKLIPIWILGMFELIFGLVIALLIYKIPLLGSPWVLISFAALYLIASLGMGLFISTITDTQQQAMFFTWFFMILFIMLGGLFTSIENMPKWAQTLTYFNPIRYFIEVVRMVMLKGSGFYEVRFHFGVMAFMAIVINTLAVMRYRKTS